MSKKSIETTFKLACERYAELGVDAEAALKKLGKIPVSLHCWQGDDVRGFESPDGDLTGGIQDEPEVGFAVIHGGSAYSDENEEAVGDGLFCVGGELEAALDDVPFDDVLKARFIDRDNA